MRVTENLGTKLKPSLGVPVQNDCTVTCDGDVYDIKSVTQTGLIRFRNREDMGKAKFCAKLIDCTEIHIERDRVAVESVSREQYHSELEQFVQRKPTMGAFITKPVKADEYYIVADGGAGFAICDDNLVGLFNDTQPSGVGKKLVGEAIRKGGLRLNCFDTDLADIYRSWGFEEYERVQWDEELAPENWDYERFGRPDVIWMSV